MSETRTIHTVTVQSVHAYTRSKTPWLLEAYGKKLFHYLSGGGLRALGRSVQQEEAEAKRNRFLVAASIIGAAWLALLVF